MADSYKPTETERLQSKGIEPDAPEAGDQSPKKAVLRLYEQISHKEAKSKDEILESIKELQDKTVKNVSIIAKHVYTKISDYSPSSVASLRKIRIYIKDIVKYYKKIKTNADHPSIPDLAQSAYDGVVGIARVFDELNPTVKGWCRRLGIDEQNKDAIVRGADQQTSTATTDF